MKTPPKSTIIPMPVLRRDKQLDSLERIIHRSLQAYYRLAAPQRSTFFLNNLISEARRKGMLLPRPPAAPTIPRITGSNSHDKD